MIAVAVNVFVIEPTRYCVFGVASMPDSYSAEPIAFDQTSWPSRTTAAATLGSRSAWRSASCRSSASDADMASERCGYELDCPLDVVLAQVEVRDSPQHPAAHRARERHIVLLEQRDRLPLAESERLHVDLHEVGLYAVELDRHPF